MAIAIMHLQQTNSKMRGARTYRRTVIEALLRSVDALSFRAHVIKHFKFARRMYAIASRCWQVEAHALQMLPIDAPGAIP